MANQCNVDVLREVVAVQSADDWKLCFQWCRYRYPDREEEGYRFIWRWPNGKLQAARGQARIPSLKIARELQELAVEQGWGKNEGIDAGLSIQH